MTKLDKEIYVTFFHVTLNHFSGISWLCLFYFIHVLNLPCLAHRLCICLLQTFESLRRNIGDQRNVICSIEPPLCSLCIGFIDSQSSVISHGQSSVSSVYKTVHYAYERPSNMLHPRDINGSLCCVLLLAFRPCEG